MTAHGNASTGIAVESVRTRMKRASRDRETIWAFAWTLAGFATFLACDPTLAAVSASKPKSGAMTQVASRSTQDVIVYAADIPKQGLSEFDVWKDPASPAGTLVGITNTGDELDPPPENDPHVTFKVK